MTRFFNIALPLVLGLVLLAIWEGIVAARHIPPMSCPRPAPSRGRSRITFRR